MKSKNATRFVPYIITYIVFGTLMIIGTFRDLQVDMALLDYTNPFGVFMERWGMFPQFTMQLLCYTMLLAAYHPLDEAFDIAESIFPFFIHLRANKITHFILAVLHKVMYVAFIYGAFMGANDCLGFLLGNGFGGNLQDILINAGVAKTIAIILWIIARFALIAIVYLLFKKIDKKYIKALEFMACAGLIMFYGSNVVNTLKDIFHRVRFREMMAYSHGLYYLNSDGKTCVDIGEAVIKRSWINDTDFSYFTRWYTPGDARGIIWQDQKSFPSGHTTAASFSMLLIPLTTHFKELKKWAVPGFVLGFGYMLAMGISRMIRGAHYLTDISGAALIMTTICILSVCILSIFQRISDKNLK